MEKNGRLTNMIAQQDQIEDLPTLFSFHQTEHQLLAVHLLNELATAIDFKLKIQKASIQLVDNKPFAVLGFRRSQKHIFFEFYNAEEINNPRIIKTLLAKNGYFINRVEIFTANDVDDELINWTSASSELLHG